MFGLSIAICSAQFTSLPSVLNKCQKTIISLTIICHSILVIPSKCLKPEASCLLTRPTGSPKFGVTGKDIPRYYTLNRPIRYMYLKSCFGSGIARRAGYLSLFYCAIRSDNFSCAAQSKGKSINNSVENMHVDNSV